MRSQIESPAHKSRYDNVDVLSMLDPNWLENTQAATLVRMMCQHTTEVDADTRERAMSILAA